MKRWLAAGLVLGMLAVSHAAGERVRCAMLVGPAAVAVNGRFLERVSADTSIQVDTEFARTSLSSVELTRYPFVVWGGKGAFRLTDTERRALGNYLHRGGFVLAVGDGGAWTRALRAELRSAAPKGRLVSLPRGHSMAKMVYRLGRPPAMEAFELKGRIVLALLPNGEPPGAEYVYANVLAYALVH